MEGVEQRMNCHILVIQDPSTPDHDPFMAMYQDLVTSGESKGIFGEDSRVSISSALGLAEAEKVLRAVIR